METIAKPLTHEAFRAMEFSPVEEKTFIFELINGDIVAKNHPTATHQRVLLELTMTIATFVKTDKLGKVFFAPFGVVLEPSSDVQPDLFVTLDANLPNLRESGFFGVPDLIVEILSSSSIKSDRNTKYRLYERTGVREYWIVDPKNQAIEVYSLTGNSYELTSFAVETGVVTSVVLPGLNVEVAGVFA